MKTNILHKIVNCELRETNWLGIYLYFEIELLLFDFKNILKIIL